jgi:hypothetical protein
MTSEPATQPRTRYLIAATLLLSATIFVVTKLRVAHFLSLETGLIIAFVVFAANVVIGLVGVFTPHRVAWLSYLAASLASMLLWGMATPLTAAWLLIRLGARVVFLGEHACFFGLGCS